jgi:hypothetical protein
MNTNIEQQLSELFNRYIDGFHAYNMQTVLSCYHLPCTLHTPEKIAYLANENDFEQEFIDIFTVLKHANITKIVATKASYRQCQRHSIDVCIDWLFYTDNNEVFTDFTAFYHIVTNDVTNGENNTQNIGKIVSVVSHELQNSVTLENALILN